MIDAFRQRKVLLVAAWASAEIGLAVALLGMRGDHFDWVMFSLSLGLLVGLSGSTLDARHGKARVVLWLLAAGLCIAGAVLAVARVSHPTGF